MANEYIAAMTSSIGLARPVIVWSGSPMGAASAGARSKDLPFKRGWANVWRDVQEFLFRYIVPGSLQQSESSEEWEATKEALDGLRRFGEGLKDWRRMSGSLRHLRDNVSRPIHDLVSSAYLQDGEYVLEQAQSLAWCDYYRTACAMEEETDPLVPLMLLAQHVSSWIMLETACYVSHKPTRIRVNHSGLHCDGGPAALYPDGCAVWALNGVGVPQWLAEPRAGDIDPSRLVGIENAEVRREFVRKVGIERILHKMKSKAIDKQGDYELVLLELKDGRRRPYLKMLNPSIGVWHAEGVFPICKTVAEALAWRNGTAEIPVALT